MKWVVTQIGAMTVFCRQIETVNREYNPNAYVKQSGIFRQVLRG